MGRPRTYDQPQALRRARDTFHDHGYTATSVAQLSKATGLSRSSLYAAFDDKHGLFIQCFSEYCVHESRGIEAELSGDNAGALRRLRAHLRLKTDDPTASLRGCLLAKFAAELAGEDPEIARMAKTFYDNYERALAGCVGQAQAAGDLRTDITAADAGAMLLAVLRGIEALGRVPQPEGALRRLAETALSSLAAAPVPHA